MPASWNDLQRQTKELYGHLKPIENDISGLSPLLEKITPVLETRKPGLYEKALLHEHMPQIRRLLESQEKIHPHLCDAMHLEQDVRGLDLADTMRQALDMLPERRPIVGVLKEAFEKGAPMDRVALCARNYKQETLKPEISLFLKDYIKTHTPTDMERQTIENLAIAAAPTHLRRSTAWAIQVDDGVGIYNKESDACIRANENKNIVLSDGLGVQHLISKEEMERDYHLLGDGLMQNPHHNDGWTRITFKGEREDSRYAIKLSEGLLPSLHHKGGDYLVFGMDQDGKADAKNYSIISQERFEAEYDMSRIPGYKSPEYTILPFPNAIQTSQKMQSPSIAQILPLPEKEQQKNETAFPLGQRLLSVSFDPFFLDIAIHSMDVSLEIGQGMQNNPEQNQFLHGYRKAVENLKSMQDAIEKNPGLFDANKDRLLEASRSLLHAGQFYENSMSGANDHMERADDYLAKGEVLLEDLAKDIGTFSQPQLGEPQNCSPYLMEKYDALCDAFYQLENVEAGLDSIEQYAALQTMPDKREDLELSIHVLCKTLSESQKEDCFEQSINNQKLYKEVEKVQSLAKDMQKGLEARMEKLAVVAQSNPVLNNRLQNLKNSLSSGEGVQKEKKHENHDYTD